MNVDKTTLEDLYIFDKKEIFSLFSHLNFTTTSRGKDWLRFFFKNPFIDIQDIFTTQEILKYFIPILDYWPSNVNNGTIMVMEKFCLTDFPKMPSNSNWLQTYFYKYYYKFHFTLIKYSVDHYSIFLNDMNKIGQILSINCSSPEVSKIVNKITLLLHNRQVFQDIINRPKHLKISDHKYLNFGYHLLASIQDSLNLMDMFGKLDALFSLAFSCKKYGFNFPAFLDQDEPLLKATQLYNPLLSNPKPADIEITPGKNFIFLTGANMAGKSTFIRSVGIAVYLAHIGMAVPSMSMTLSVYNGIHSNIQISDNILKGESFFFNEVQRIKNTLEKITDGKKWLILIDELFKGTNIYDARICSLAVIEGMSKLRNTSCILSTHLYEVAKSLFRHKNIQYRYFEIVVEDDNFSFTYRLLNGVSNDEIGYLILKDEGVISLLGEL